MPKPFYEDNNKKIQEIIRVNHAGEFGAQRIYLAQIKYTSNYQDKKVLAHMLEQEQEHLDYFSQEIKNGRARPTIFMPIWKLLGYLIGAVSAKINIKTAMLLTENVETVIEEHYQQQIDYLEHNNSESQILAKIKKFRDDEIDHKNIAMESNNSGILTLFLSKFIQRLCKSAIFLSKKL